MIIEADSSPKLPAFFLFVPVLARRKARETMEEEREKNEIEKREGRKERIRASQHPVDFIRVEDMGPMSGLTPFELETKRRMAALSKTPVDELISAEESKSQRVFKCAAMRMLMGLIRRKGFLSRRLWLAYELCYVGKLPEEKAAYLMGITRVNMRKVHQNLRRSLARVLKKKKQDEIFLKKVKFLSLTRRQSRIVRLRFCEGFTSTEIAKLTSRSKRGVNEVVQRVRRKLFQA